MQLPGVILRPATDDDMPYVTSTWVRSHVSNVRNRTRRDKWRGEDGIGRTCGARHQARYMQPVLDHPGRVLVVACSERDERALHGFACTLGGAVVFLYVTDDLRGHGLGRALVATALGAYPQSIPHHYNVKLSKVTARYHLEPLSALRTREAA